MGAREPSPRPRFKLRWALLGAIDRMARVQEVAIRSDVSDVWADGVYLQARTEEAAECMLVLIGATPEGKKELVASRPGSVRAHGAGRASHRHKAAWARDCARSSGRRRRARLLEGDRGGLSEHQAPALLGSTANVLNKVALTVQVNMKVDLREI